MPYSLDGNCVVKTGTGEKIKCHETRAAAQSHLAALQINVEDATKKEFQDWGMSPEQASERGTLRTLFNGKVHEAMTSITDQLTMRGYLSEEENMTLTRIKGDVLRLLNLELPDQLASMLLDLKTLDEIAFKEVQSVLLESKETNSNRWTLITSSAYRDRDNQIVSLKAHERDIAYMEATGNYGTLDWWHMHPAVFERLESKEAVAQLPLSIQKNGIIIGDCDFSALYGKLRIESGTYRDPDVGKIMQLNAKELSASLLFYRPKTEPDSNGVFSNIHTVSRALMPRGKVSNLAPLMAHLN